MAVDPSTLQTPERGMVLETRVTPDALASLKARIERARTLQPSAKERHCVDCFERGRNAAIRAIETEAT